MAIDVNDLRKGTTFTTDGQLWRVLEYAHNKPGRGNATIRVKCRNLRTSATVEMTFSSGYRVEDISLDHDVVQFLYRDDTLVHFMNTATYEQPVVAAEAIEEALPYLLEGMEVKLTTYQGEPLDIELPVTVDMEVAEAPIAVRGDTSGAVTKKVTTQTGLVVEAPQFIDVGDIIRIDTRTGAYVTRVNK